MDALDSGLGLAGGLLGCIVSAGFVSAMETALVGVPAARLQNAIDAKVYGAKRLIFWAESQGQVLIALHFARLFLVLGAGALADGLVRMYALPIPTGVTIMLVAMVGLFLSHLVPRAMAKRNPLRWAIATAPLSRLLSLVLKPIVWPLGRLGVWVAQLMGIPVDNRSPFWTPDELGRLADNARAEGLGQPSEDLLLSIIEFSDTIIREIMVPRTEMVAIAMDSPSSELRQTIIEGAHSRIPVYEESIDNIIGILHVKDLFVRDLQHDGARDHIADNLNSLVRPTFFVPEVMKISELLRDFQRRKTHMAIVVDEYGGTAGVVTLEDIIEEIVGEIQDEYDVDEKQFRVIGDNKIIADGRVSVWDLEEALGMEFPDDAGYETLAGFLMSRAGYLPEPGTTITWNNCRFIIKEANEKRIGMVEIERRDHPPS